ncbi:MAG: hypothetical protein OQJ93_08305 [Ignavibacteriaceae bacterium]|jgi:hypothetical protein|nr:hypothetical protein [Ignavibacteriaceae bacterium]MCW8813767.1 hypothetical protein [Chlorobium sp.]MCW8816542.1 hypothetical protein [Ignavibacteriaceae bacterium]MCW8824304.1 hypothetical protein [Ignavibacteriaceae bacterium]MCW8960998.1 hypothetical protein [Ignavibacteriaceae bacterium]
MRRLFKLVFHKGYLWYGDSSEVIVWTYILAGRDKQLEYAIEMLK